MADLEIPTSLLLIGVPSPKSSTIRSIVVIRKEPHIKSDIRKKFWHQSGGIPVICPIYCHSRDALLAGHSGGFHKLSRKRLSALPFHPTRIVALMAQDPIGCFWNGIGRPTQTGLRSFCLPASHVPHQRVLRNFNFRASVAPISPFALSHEFYQN